MAPPLPHYVRTHRRHSPLTQEELSALLGRSGGHVVSRLETFQRGTGLDVAILLELLFDEPVSELFAGVRHDLVRTLHIRTRKLLERVDLPERAVELKDWLDDVLSRAGAPLERRRLLSVGPRGGCLHFSVLEGHGDRSRLLDWGWKRARGRSARAIAAKVMLLCEQYLPDTLILEDLERGRTLRRKRVAKILRRVQEHAQIARQDLQALPRQSVVDHFERLGARTLQDRAGRLAELYPVLMKRLPPPREPWMSEDTRIGLFDTVAFAQVAMENSNVR